MTHMIERDGVSLDDRDDKARAAVAAFRKLQPTLTAYARVICRNPRVRVEMAANDNGSTDGQRIFYRPPLALAERIEHVRSQCDRRDERKQQICPACAQREDVLTTIYHEIAHIALDSMAQPTDDDKVTLVRDAVDRMSSAYAARVRDRIESAPPWRTRSYMGLVGIVSDYLPMIFNALEDARVNRGQFTARKGTKVMFEAQAWKVFTEGFEARDPITGEIKHISWKQQPQNMQVVVGLYCKGAGYDYSDWFIPPVVAALDDEQVTSLVNRLASTRSAKGVYELTFPILARLKELGFCAEKGDEPEPEPEPEDDDDLPQPEGESDDESDDEGTDSGSDSEEERGDSGDVEDDAPEDDSSVDASDSDSDGGDDADESGAAGEDGADEPDSESDGASDEPDSGSADGADEPDDAKGDAVDDSATDEPGESDSDSDGDAEGGEPEPSDDASSESADSDSGSGSSEASNEEGDVDEEATDADGSGDTGDSDGPGSNPGSPGGTPSEPGDGPSSPDAEPTPGVAADSAFPDAGDDDADGDADDAHSSLDGADDFDADGDLIDTGADEGHGGTTLNEDSSYDDVPMGDADDVTDGLKVWTGHFEPPKSYEEERNDRADSEAIKKAIIQGMYFEHPSRFVNGVNIHRYGDDFDGKRNAWDKVWGSSGGAVGEYDPPESALGKALLQMRVVFADNARAKIERHHKTGKVDVRVLGKRAPAHDERLFKRKTLPGKRDYFVVLGLDISGSTIGVNIDLIKRAAFAQANLLSRMGIKFAVYAHTGVLHAGTRSSGFDLEMYVIKEGNEPWDNKAKQALSEIGPLSANLDGHSLEFYRRLCDTRSETDKIILYYSDGKMPQENHDEELEILQREIKTCKRRGITLLGVGVRTDSPARHGLETVQVDDVADVHKVVTQLGKHLAVRR